MIDHRRGLLLEGLHALDEDRLGVVRTLGELCARIESLDLFPMAPVWEVSRIYRIWGFESAALDLALRQNGLPLFAALRRTPKPMRYVVSLGLGDPPTLDPVKRRLALDPTLAAYTLPLHPVEARGILLFARLHLLPESYLMGLVDVKQVAVFYPTFIFGKVYAHGVWWYFPAVILIKTTLGMLALVALATWAVLTGRLRKGRELAFILLPWAVYLGVAMVSGMNIGSRNGC